MHFTKRVVAEGHVTVPTDLRQILGIAVGDLVEFQIVGIIRKKSVSPVLAEDCPTPSPNLT